MTVRIQGNAPNVYIGFRFTEFSHSIITISRWLCVGLCCVHLQQFQLHNWS